MTRAAASILFDLDGTLADTAPDLALALNNVLAEQGLPPLPLAQVRPAASHGAMAMLRVAMPHTPDETLLPLRDRFIFHYRANLVRHTTLFPGTLDMLTALERCGLTWGIVTNKVAHLTEPLLEALNLRHRAACVVCGDTTAHAKPHPAPLLHACDLLGCDPADTVYVGDSSNDVEAARRAGMRVVVASYGYMDGTDNPKQWAPDLIIDCPADLLAWDGLGAIRQ